MMSRDARHNTDRLAPTLERALVRECAPGTERAIEALCDGPRDRRHWNTLCAVVATCHIHHPERLEWLEEIDKHLDSWPVHVRRAPQEWQARLKQSPKKWAPLLLARQLEFTEELDDTLAQALTQNPHMSKLSQLTLYNVTRTPTALATILRSSDLSGLEGLFIPHNRLDPSVFIACDQNQTIGELDTLGLSGTRASASELETALTRAKMRRLRALDLSFNEFEDIDLFSLLRSPLFREHLEVLDLSYNHLDGSSLLALIETAPAEKLQRLRLHGNPLSPRTRAKLGASWLGPLIELSC